MPRHACKAAWADPPQQLSLGREGLAVIFDMRLCCFSSVMRRVLKVSMSQMRVMGSCLVFPCFICHQALALRVEFQAWRPEGSAVE
ncbi:MAG: hypothetical protein WBL50_02215 [Candidatus Acidiferrum sp.]